MHLIDIKLEVVFGHSESALHFIGSLANFPEMNREYKIILENMIKN